MATKRKRFNPAIEGSEYSSKMSILGLPELVLDYILEKLSPISLCNMAGACTSLRDRCKRDCFWEKLMNEKWSSVIGEAARREWELYLALRKKEWELYLAMRKEEWESVSRGLVGSLNCLWPLSWINSRLDGGGKTRGSPMPDDSIMLWYLSLESGKFQFPGQVYNREGSVMSCYDVELSYDRHTNTFQARYPTQNRRITEVEEGVQWDRIRAPPVDTSAHDLHASECLNDLCPGDHFEVQWRMYKEDPHGWWYGMIGHLETCDGNVHFCRCSTSDTIILEFNHFSPESRWRRATISRKDHKEEGDETDGFYGGIRKLYDKDEISRWTSLWPTEVLE